MCAFAPEATFLGRAGTRADAGIVLHVALMRERGEKRHGEALTERQRDRETERERERVSE